MSGRSVESLECGQVNKFATKLDTWFAHQSSVMPTTNDDDNDQPDAPRSRPGKRLSVPAVGLIVAALLAVVMLLVGRAVLRWIAVFFVP